MSHNFLVHDRNLKQTGVKSVFTYCSPYYIPSLETRVLLNLSQDITGWHITIFSTY